MDFNASEQTSVATEDSAASESAECQKDLNVAEYYQSSSDYLLDSGHQSQFAEQPSGGESSQAAYQPDQSSPGASKAPHPTMEFIGQCKHMSSEEAVREAIKKLQMKNETEKIELFCYICNYGFKSFPRLIRHMETKKHANQVEKYHSMGSGKHCYGGHHHRHHRHVVYHHRASGHQRHKPPIHFATFYPGYSGYSPFMRHPPMLPLTQTYAADTTTGATSTTANADIDSLPEDVINQMIDSLGENEPKDSESFAGVDNANISEILNFLN